MKPYTPPSDELKNAFVDRELAAAERHEIQARALSDGELRNDLCELNTLKDLVRGAYDGVDTRRPISRDARGGALRVAALAIVCVSAGWIAHAGFSQRSASISEATLARNVASDAASRAIPARANQVLLHVSTRDPDELRSVLSAAETLLSGAQRESRPMQVEIVANSAGIDLLRADVSPVADRIAELKSRYPGLKLIACNQTMDRLRERGESVVLLPGVGVATSALDQIVVRMQKGWLYLRT